MSQARDDRPDAEALLITGPYGSGKTSLIEELAVIAEHDGTRFAAVDLDWLGWFDHGMPDHDAGWPLLLRNLDAVVTNYHEAGVRRFYVAGVMGGRREVADLRAAMRMPVATVRLTVPIEEIERRLRGAVTAGRAEDLEVARDQIARGAGHDVGELVVANDRPIREVATEILDWFGAKWRSPGKTL